MEQPLSPASEGEATDRARSSITDGDKEEKQNRTKKKQGDRDDAQEITAFWKYIFNRKSLSSKFF